MRRTAAMKAGRHRETATKYLEAGEGPPPDKKQGRRRLDPLAIIWPGADAWPILTPVAEPP
jgi:hypothetical protein